MTENALALIETKQGNSLIEAFQPNGLESLIKAYKERALAFKGDISTPKGRDEIRSFAATIAKDKIKLEKLGKQSVEDLQKTVKIVTSERIRAVEALQDIQDAVRKPLTDWENAEKQRVDYMERMIKHIELCGVGIVGDAPQPLQICLRELEEKINITQEEYKEFEPRAQKAKEDSLARLHASIEKNRKETAEREELERLRKEDAERKQREHEEKIKAEAAEKARKEAEEHARIVAAKEAARVKADQERLEQERLKAELEKQAEKERADKAERDRIAAEEKAKKDAMEAKAKAERETVLAADKAEREKQEAIQKERNRVEAENNRIEAEAAAREADKEHKAKINNEAMHGILKAITENHIANKEEAEKVAKSVIQAIAKSKVQHVRISY